MTLSMVAKKRLKRLHTKLCDELGIPSVPHLKFSRVFYQCVEKMGEISYYDHKITINPTVSYRDARSTVAHETYHWYQYQTGLIDGQVYKGSPKNLWKQKGPWSTWPWERAANRFADKRFRRK